MRPIRNALWCAAAFTAALANVPAGAETFPTRPITFVVAFAPGGAGDSVAREVARVMGKNMGQPVVIDNRATPNVGPTLVAKSKPDGYTMLLAGNGTAITATLFKSLPYSLMGEFTHVSTLGLFDMALVTGIDSPFKSVADVVAYAKANPGKLNIGSVRLGSTQNLAAEMFKSMAGINAVLVPYRSTADLVTAVRTKDVQVAFEIVSPILGQFSSKTIRPIAVTSKKRFSGLPDTPTIAESGIADFDASSWCGISVPAGTPKPIVDYLSKQAQVAIATPEVQQALLKIGVVPSASSPEEMHEKMKADIAKWGEVIERAGIPKQ